MQQCVSLSQSCEFEIVFHEHLIEFFGDHIISGITMFPVAGYLEMGLAAVPLMSSTYSTVELVDVKFVQPFDVTARCKMTSIYHFGSGIQFLDSKEGQHVAASISRINPNPAFVAMTKALSNLRATHSKQVADFPGHYNPLASSQTIQNARLSKGDTSVLAQISLPSDVKHEYDAYYVVHPALLDATFQLLGIMVRSYGQL